MASSDAQRLGFDPARLDRIDAFLQNHYIATGQLPNAQLLIAREGEIAHFSSFGTARESGGSIDGGSLFRIASMTKPIVSVAFMTLVEEGRVALDTPVGDVLPELAAVAVYDGGGGGVPFRTRPLAEPMRMVDLLRHTAGFTYGFQNRSNIDAAYREAKLGEWRSPDDLSGFVARLAELPLEFAPGSAWNYSVATDVVGAAIERLSGQTLDQFLHDRVLVPLGMTDTGFLVPADRIDRLTDCYTWHAERRARVLFDRADDSLWARPMRFLSGGGGLVSTTLDYHRFCRMLEGNGALDGVRILGRKTVDLMRTNHLPGRADLTAMSRSLFSETQNAGTGFGLGCAVVEDVARTMMPGSVGEYYWGGLFATSFFIDPVERLHAIFMTQLSPSSLYPIRRELKTMIYSALV